MTKLLSICGAIALLAVGGCTVTASESYGVRREYPQPRVILKQPRIIHEQPSYGRPVPYDRHHYQYRRDRY